MGQGVDALVQSNSRGLRYASDLVSEIKRENYLNKESLGFILVLAKSNGILKD